PPFFHCLVLLLLSNNFSAPNAASLNLRKLTTPISTTANITFRLPCLRRASSGLSLGGSSSGMLSNSAPIWLIVGTLVSLASRTATRKSGSGGLVLRYVVEGFQT